MSEYSSVRIAYFKELAKEICSITSPSKILDAGCGSGELVASFRDLGLEAYGVDISEKFLSHAPGNIRPFLTIANMNHARVSFDDSTFDLVTSHHSIEHLTNPANLVKEASRILKPGGMLFIETNTPPRNRQRRIQIAWVRAYSIRYSP